jgi:hypothetical protein
MTAQTFPGLTVTRIQPLVTGREARRLGFSRSDYNAAVSVFHGACGAHQSGGGVGLPSADRPLDDEVLMREAMASANTVISQGCEDNLDPLIAEVETSLEATARAIEELDRWDERTVTTTDDSTRYRLPSAGEEVGHLDERVLCDRLAGLRHHERIGPVLRHVSRWLLPLDIAALAVFFGTAVNVDLTHPWLDPVAGLTVLFVVLAAVLGQMNATIRAADAFNERRQAMAEGRRGDAELSNRTLIRWTAITGVATCTLVTLLVYRVLTIAGSGVNVPGLVVLTSFAAAAGLAAPMIKFIAIGFDGSTHSRRRDGINSALGQHDAARFETIDIASSCLHRIDAAKHTYQFLQRRMILDQANDALAGGHRRVQLLRLMLGRCHVTVSPAVDNLWDVTSRLPHLPGPIVAPLAARDCKMATLVRAAECLRNRLQTHQLSRHELAAGGDSRDDSRPTPVTNDE